MRQKGECEKGQLLRRWLQALYKAKPAKAKPAKAKPAKAKPAKAKPATV
jgi:hypothetical protein